MHKFLLLLFTEILALGACKGPEYYKNRFTLGPAEKPLEITIGSETKNFVYYSQFVRIGKENYLGILNFERNRIEIYDLGSRKLFKELQFYSDGPETFGEVSGFFIENLDSLVVDCFYQRVVGISDGNGKVVKKI